MPISLVLIAHNIRSTHNIGSLLRTADGLGVEKIYFSGYTPYPKYEHDERLPHIANKIHNQISKTALGAEDSVAWEHFEDITNVLKALKDQDYEIAGLEQTKTSVQLPDFKPPQKLAILLGSEVTGIDHELITQMDYCLEIPMIGTKESFNVVEASTMAMYHCLVVNRL